MSGLRCLVLLLVPVLGLLGSPVGTAAAQAGREVWLGSPDEPALEHEATDPATGHRLQLYDRRFTDAVNQSQRSEIEVRALDPEGAVVGSHRFEAHQRWVYRYELELLLMLAGFARWEIQGDFDGAPLTRDDQQMIAWAWREPA